MPKHELILLKNMMQPGYTGSLQDYERAGGYQALRKVLAEHEGMEVPALRDNAAAMTLAPEGAA